MSKLCLLLGVAVLPLIHGAAVLDLINLFHQYEDDILGRGQGVNPEPIEIDDETEAGKIGILNKTEFKDQMASLWMMCPQNLLNMSVQKI